MEILLEKYLRFGTLLSNYIIYLLFRKRIKMDYKEIIPKNALRKFDAMCLHNEYLHQNKELQRQILDCIADKWSVYARVTGICHVQTKWNSRQS